MLYVYGIYLTPFPQDEFSLTPFNLYVNTKV
nr:MAG TPA: hypothetical protein [Caudoviricetes sp.]